MLGGAFSEVWLLMVGVVIWYLWVWRPSVVLCFKDGKAGLILCDVVFSGFRIGGGS